MDAPGCGGARDYAFVVASALGAAFAMVETGGREAEKASPDGSGPGGLLVLGSEHRFVGGLNRMVIDHAERGLLPGDRLFVVGSRGRLEAAGRGIEFDWSLPMISRLDGVPALARSISYELYRRFVGENIVGVSMMFARTAAAGRWSVEQRSLLPLDPSLFSTGAGSTPPLSNLGPDRLLDRLAEEYVFAELVLGAMETLASENAARLAAMGAALDNIERRLGDVRREEVTIEFLDVIAAAEALHSD